MIYIDANPDYFRSSHHINQISVAFRRHQSRMKTLKGEYVRLLDQCAACWSTWHNSHSKFHNIGNTTPKAFATTWILY